MWIIAKTTSPRLNMENTFHSTESVLSLADNLLLQKSATCPPDGPAFGNHTDSDYAKAIYNLRPRSTTPGSVSPKFEDELPQAVKHKRPRNSLKKRLLVNARERERMRVLNQAFQSLRDALPCYIADGHMAKITTLRLAINYIKALTEVLKDDPAPISCLPSGVASSSDTARTFAIITEHIKITTVSWG